MTSSFYAAHEEATFRAKVTALAGKFERLKFARGGLTSTATTSRWLMLYLSGLRYFDVFDQIDDLHSANTKGCQMAARVGRMTFNQKCGDERLQSTSLEIFAGAGRIYQTS